MGRIKKIICITSIASFAIIASCIGYTYCKTNRHDSVYKISNTFNLNDIPTFSPKDETLTMRADENIYLSNNGNSLIIGKLNDGDRIFTSEQSTDGWCKIIYRGAEAYVKTIGLMRDTTTSFTEINDQLYVIPDSLEVLSVDKSNESKQTVYIQELVTRVAENPNGISKIVKDGNEYYIDTAFLSTEKPIIWTNDEKELVIGAFDGATLWTDCKETGIIGTINWADDIKQLQVGDNGWSKVLYNDQEAYIKTELLAEGIYPIVYEDETGKVTITKEWYENAWCYIAHLEFTDYDRFGTSCANGKYGGGYETTSSAANRLGALLCVNGCYSAPYLGYKVARDGVVCNGGTCYSPGVYSSYTGLLKSAWESGGDAGYVGASLNALVSSGKVTDTFCFGPPILMNGYVKAGSGGGRAQRTFIGTNGEPGDLWVVVSDGRKNDGESSGLTYTQCAKLLKEKGCKLGVPLDGGGSTTMWFNGKVLNAAAGNERAVVDFLYFK